MNIIVNQQQSLLMEQSLEATTLREVGQETVNTRSNKDIIDLSNENLLHHLVVGQDQEVRENKEHMAEGQEIKVVIEVGIIEILTEIETTVKMTNKGKNKINIKYL